MSKKIHPSEIDAILPQTQCGLCGHKGCMPYANALAYENAPIDQCPPGGVSGLEAIAQLLDKDPAPFIAEMEKKAKPKMVAIIREDECIGCTKCIQACPVDAILGTGKQMHTVIADECTGCELCITPCPVDCIDLVTLAEPANEIKKMKADIARERFLAREMRLANQEKSSQVVMLKSSNDAKKSFIEAALLRAKQKKS